MSLVVPVLYVVLFEIECKVEDGRGRKSGMQDASGKL